MHTLKLTDLELTALMIHFEGYNDKYTIINIGDRYNCNIGTKSSPI